MGAVHSGHSRWMERNVTVISETFGELLLIGYGSEEDNYCSKSRHPLHCRAAGVSSMRVMTVTALEWHYKVTTRCAL